MDFSKTTECLHAPPPPRLTPSPRSSQASTLFFDVWTWLLGATLILGSVRWGAQGRGKIRRYGLAATPDQFLDRRPGYRGPLPGLYLCGGSTRSGHGISGALASGVHAARTILKG